MFDRSINLQFLRTYASAGRVKSARKFESWVGFDLDGTLAKSREDFDPEKVGKPIPKMIARLKAHLEDGDTCKIMTARASVDYGQATRVIQKWLVDQDLPELEVTCEKDPGMKKLYDDRAASVKENKGVVKEAVIKHEGDEWVLYTADGKRVLGRHKKPEDAYKQEYAIQKSQERAKSAAIDQGELRYWGDVNDAVVAAGGDPARDAVVGSCGHPIRQSKTGGQTIEIGKKCLLCLKADGVGQQKEASKADKLLRLGKLSGDSMRRLGLDVHARRDFTSLERFGHLGKIDKSYGARGNIANFHARRVRDHLTPAIGELPTARTAYNSGDNSQILARLQSVSKNAPSRFDLDRMLENTAPVKGRPAWERPSLLSRKGLDQTLGSLLRPQSWVGKKKIMDIPAGYYDGSRNVVGSARLGTAVSRHEMGHWLHQLLSSGNHPKGALKLSGRVLPDVMALRRFSPGFGESVGNFPHAHEFVGHLLAASGPGRGAARLRKATEPGKWMLPGVAKDQAKGLTGLMRKHPATKDREGLISTIQHLIRNYEYRLPTKSAAVAALRRARNDTHTHPTPAQAHEGNYRKGEFQWQGLTIKLENPKGSTRVGYGKDGKKEWSRMMHADYGYFKGTKAIDGDAIDCFVGPNLGSELIVAIDQYKGSGAYDETKFILGCDSQESAEKLYLRHYPRGWRLGPTSTCTVQQLKDWLKDGNHQKPFKGQDMKAA